MGFEDFLEVRTLIKFGVLGILVVALVFFIVDAWKWKILLSLSGLVGLALALSGKTIGRDHGFGGGR